MAVLRHDLRSPHGVEPAQMSSDNPVMRGFVQIVGHIT